MPLNLYRGEWEMILCLNVYADPQSMQLSVIKLSELYSENVACKIGSYLGYTASKVYLHNHEFEPLKK